MVSNLSKTWNRFILTLIGGLELVVVVIELLSLVDVWYYQLALAAIGAVIVIFKIVARLRKRYGTWFVGACLSFILTFTFLISVLSIGIDATGNNVNIVAANPAKSIVVASAATQRATSAWKEANDELKRLQSQRTVANIQTNEERRAALERDIATQAKTVEAKLAAVALSEQQDQLNLKTLAAVEQQTFNGIKVFARIAVLLGLVTQDFVLGFAIVLGLMFVAGFCWFVELTMIASATDSVREEEENNVLSSSGSGSSDNVVLDGDPERVGPAISYRQYLLAAWPPTSRRISMVADVAKMQGWEVTDCEAAEQELFKGFKLEVDGKKQRLQPDIEREKFLRQRRSKNK